MIVAKFGGMSIDGKKSIERVIEIIKELSSSEKKLIILFSAAGKTTKKLLDCFASLKSKDLSTTKAIYDDIVSYHLTLSICKRLKQQLNSLLEEIKVLSTKSELTDKDQDSFVAQGELLSSYLLRDILIKERLPIQLVDARTIIKTDNSFQNASPIIEICNIKITKAVSTIVNEGKILLTQGFIGSTVDEKTTTLGLEGSDYSAAIIGAAVNAKEVRLYKTVSGIMTADPSIVKAAKIVSNLSYDEASTLSQLGAKCLHPKTIIPLKKKNIPIKILNSQDPTATGTLISSFDDHKPNTAKSIAFMEEDGMCTISVVDLDCTHKVKAKELAPFLNDLHKIIFK